ncbi:MAG: hypothetical protein WBK51_11160 [Polaromonas sp.]
MHEKVTEPALLSHFYMPNWPFDQSNRAQAAPENIANKKLELIHPWNVSQRTDDQTYRLASSIYPPTPRLLPNPTMACRSFSKFYERARCDAASFADLL